MRFLLLFVLLGVGYSLQARETYLKTRDLILIQKHWQDYLYASKKVGVPAFVLAAIHYREADLANRGNVGGPFMLDLGPLNDPPEFVRRIRKHEEKVYRLYGGKCETAPKVSDSFRFSALVAAHHLKLKARCKLTTEACIAYAVWGYNGRASWHRDKRGKKTHKRSSYVWADPKNGVFLKMRYTNRHGVVKEFIDQRPGVMVLYRELLSVNWGDYEALCNSDTVSPVSGG